MAASELESNAWYAFDSCSTSTMSIISSDSIDSLAKNNELDKIKFDDGLLSDVLNLNCKENIQIQESIKLDFKSILSQSFSLPFNQLNSEFDKTLLIDIIQNDSLWNKLLDNYGKRLPISWKNTKLRTSLINQLFSDQIDMTLEINPISNHNDDYMSDLENNEVIDMHSMLVSLHQENLESTVNINGDNQQNDYNQIPLFTADQVIKEIEEMMNESSPSPSHDASIDGSICFKFSKIALMEENKSHVRPAVPILENIESLSVMELCELYDEMESYVRDLSEFLVEELAYRDELEYDKEIKNQFISIFLSIQHKKKEFIASSLNLNKSPVKSGEVSKALNTVIPYDDVSGSPTSQLLLIFIKILKAMLDDNPKLPQLLTDYILKVVCPS